MEPKLARGETLEEGAAISEICPLLLQGWRMFACLAEQPAQAYHAGTIELQGSDSSTDWQYSQRPWARATTSPRVSTGMYALGMDRTPYAKLIHECIQCGTAQLS